jgi:hypothetical protein
MGFEPTTSSLPRRCSTPELSGQDVSNMSRTPSRARPLQRSFLGSGMTGSNRRRSAWKADALPTELIPRIAASSLCRALDPDSRPKRREPYDSGGWWVRTTVGYCRQIYSLLPLAARATLRNSRCQRFSQSNDCWRAAIVSPSWRRELNPQPPVYKTGALPLSYASFDCRGRFRDTAPARRVKCRACLQQGATPRPAGNREGALSKPRS